MYRQCITIEQRPVQSLFRAALPLPMHCQLSIADIYSQRDFRYKLHRQAIFSVYKGRRRPIQDNAFRRWLVPAGRYKYLRIARAPAVCRPPTSNAARHATIRLKITSLFIFQYTMWINVFKYYEALKNDCLETLTWLLHAAWFLI